MATCAFAIGRLCCASNTITRTGNRADPLEAHSTEGTINATRMATMAITRSTATSVGRRTGRPCEAVSWDNDMVVVLVRLCRHSPYGTEVGRQSRPYDPSVLLGDFVNPSLRLRQGIVAALAEEPDGVDAVSRLTKLQNVVVKL